MTALLAFLAAVTGLVGVAQGAGAAALPADDETPFVIVEDRLVITAGGLVYRREVDEVIGDGFAPPLPPVPQAWEVAELTDDGREWLVERLDDAGFLDPPPDYGDLDVTDSAEFRLVVTTGSGPYVHEVFWPEESVGERAPDAARRRLVELVDDLENLDHLLGDDLGPFEPYVPEEWSILPAPGVEASGRWPFDEPPTSHCTDFAGEKAARRGGRDTASGAYEGDGTVLVDALLPGEDCPT